MINTSVLLCHECDLIVKNQVLAEGSRLQCPRCKHTLYRQCHNTVSRALAYTITALLCYYPAMSQSIIVINIGGHFQVQNIIQGSVVLLHEGYYFVAILTFMCSALIPLMRLLLLFYITLNVTFERFRPNHFWAFRLYHYMEQWSMLDVYMLGIIVSVVKMSSMAEVQIGAGLWAYIALLLMTILSSNRLNSHEVWSILLKRRQIQLDSTH